MTRKTAFLPILAILAALGKPAVLAAQEAELATTQKIIDDAIALALRQNPFHLASQEKIAQARAGVPGRRGLPADAEREGPTAWTKSSPSWSSRP